MATSTGAATTEKNYLLLLAAAGVLLFISISGLFVYQAALARDQSLLNSYRLLSDTLRSLSKTGTDVAAGVPPNFELVLSLTQGFDQTLEAYRGGDSGLGINAVSVANRAEFDALEAAWTPMKAQLKVIQDNAAPYQRAAVNIKEISEIVPGAIASYSAVIERTASTNALMNLQLKRLYRILQLSRQALADGSESGTAADSLSKEVEQFKRDHLTVTTNGSMDRASAKDVSEGIATIETAALAIQQDIKPVAALQVAAQTLPTFEQGAQTATENLRQKIQASLGVSKSVTLISALGTIVALIMVGLFVYLTITQSRRREAMFRAQEQQQQQSILSLLDEITNIANGDLTGELTVTADFTGNIADSLNFTVQTLRGLVGTINETSVEIAAAASSTTERVQQMSTSSEGQAREIVRATQAISFGSRSLEEVATRAEKLAEQAKVSVDTAHNGAATVGRTIAGMATLREQIQDTAKRIKRLGESSQEIGNIIEFINDIAEQTNTLALNASIQAAMAGESGRGFAVVADEVQRLAERAAAATKQIESLVKTIQTDTQEAITSMERSTTNVVGGAKSAEEAGLALTRIEASSQELAKVIQDIAGASRAQSAETTKLAVTMQGIREVSVQTSVSAHQTAESVGELSALSAKLRESVAGFKLPMDESNLYG